MGDLALISLVWTSRFGSADVAPHQRPSQRPLAPPRLNTFHPAPPVATDPGSGKKDKRHSAYVSTCFIGNKNDSETKRQSDAGR